MSRKAPIIRQANWLSVVPHLIVMGIMVFVWSQISSENAFLYGAMTYC